MVPSKGRARITALLQPVCYPCRCLAPGKVGKSSQAAARGLEHAAGETRGSRGRPHPSGAADQTVGSTRHVCARVHECARVHRGGLSRSLGGGPSGPRPGTHLPRQRGVSGEAVKFAAAPGFSSGSAAPPGSGRDCGGDCAGARTGWDAGRAEEGAGPPGAAQNPLSSPAPLRPALASPPPGQERGGLRTVTGPTVFSASVLGGSGESKDKRSRTSFQR